RWVDDRANVVAWASRSVGDGAKRAAATNVVTASFSGYVGTVVASAGSLSRRCHGTGVVGCGVISISVLGPVELHRDDVAVPVRPGKTTELLIRLALEAGAMVRTERLIEDLWA